MDARSESGADFLRANKHINTIFAVTLINGGNPNKISHYAAATKPRALNYIPNYS